MKQEHVFRIALVALAATVTCAVANADQPTDTSQLIQPSFGRLIPTTYPLVQPNYSRLKTAKASQLSQPAFDRMIPTIYPLVVPSASGLKVMTYQVMTPGVPQLPPETKSLHPEATTMHVIIHSSM